MMMTTAFPSIDRLAAGLGLFPPDMRPLPEPGSAFGRFALLRHLGSGAHAEVFGAYDPVLHREVALKVLGRPAEAEARALGRVSHPNVVSLYDAGTSAGRGFLAMELVDGPCLRRHLANTAVSTFEILRMFVQLADGLHAVHGAGYVHRDVKPDNVLVASDGRVRLADFGLVERIDQPVGDPAGTPAYMAPELFDGVAPSPASDQFAFAVTLFEALLGHRPFDGRSVFELQQRMQSNRLPRGWSSLPFAVRRMLRRALAAEPSRRFESMATVSARLRGALRAPVALLGGVQ